MESELRTLTLTITTRDEIALRARKAAMGTPQGAFITRYGKTAEGFLGFIGIVSIRL